MEDVWGYFVIGICGALCVGIYAGAVLMFEFCKRHIRDLELEAEGDREFGDD